MKHTILKVPGLAFLAISFVAGCEHDAIDLDKEAGEPAAGADAQASESASYTDPWYFCVDHPCPDLAAINYGLCPMSSGLLEVGVKNVGNASAGPTTTRVEFVGYATQYLSTPGLNASGKGSQKVSWIPVPSAWLASCTTSICRWRVSADVYDVVSEIDGQNNLVSGNCFTF
jgi:hypothetical protein